jgi:hypothetical protein
MVPSLPCCYPLQLCDCALQGERAPGRDQGRPQHPCQGDADPGGCEGRHEEDQGE